MKKTVVEDGHVQVKGAGLGQILPYALRKEPTLPTP